MSLEEKYRKMFNDNCASRLKEYQGGKLREYCGDTPLHKVCYMGSLDDPICPTPKITFYRIEEEYDD